MSGLENAGARAFRIMGEISDASKGTYSKGELKTILNSISAVGSGDSCNSECHADSMRRGDVFIAKLVGGKVRPWITLSVRSEVVVAVAMSSSDSAPRMTKAKSRFWPGSWIGSTVSAFDESTARLQVTRPYSNDAHLREVERHLHSLMGLRQ